MRLVVESWERSCYIKQGKSERQATPELSREKISERRVLAQLERQSQALGQKLKEVRLPSLIVQLRRLFFDETPSVLVDLQVVLAWRSLSCVASRREPAAACLLA